jgi:hypothetical protein
MKRAVPVTAVKADLTGINGIKGIKHRPRSKVQGPKAKWFLEYEIWNLEFVFPIPFIPFIPVDNDVF